MKKLLLLITLLFTVTIYSQTSWSSSRYYASRGARDLTVLNTWTQTYQDSWGNWRTGTFQRVRERRWYQEWYSGHVWYWDAWRGWYWQQQSGTFWRWYWWDHVIQVN